MTLTIKAMQLDWGGATILQSILFF